MTSRTPVAPRLIVAALTALATPAWAQEAPPMVGGTTTSDYEQVGVLVACTSDGCWDFCSGTLIEDTWVLTAAHCVVAMDEAVRYYRATPYFGVGPTVDSLTDYQEVVQYIEHPSYSERTLANDIGLLELAGTLSGIDPMPLREESPSSIGSDTFRYVGYGVTRDDRSDSGTKRYGDIPLDSYDDQFIYAYDSSGRTNVCFGDSGGAGLEPVSGGYLLGAVNSFVAPGCAGGYTGHVETYSVGAGAVIMRHVTGDDSIFYGRASGLDTVAEHAKLRRRFRQQWQALLHDVGMTDGVDDGIELLAASRS